MLSHSTEEIQNRIHQNQQKVELDKIAGDYRFDTLDSTLKADKDVLSGNSEFVESLRKKGASKVNATSGCGTTVGLLVFGIVVLLVVRSCGGCGDSLTSNCSVYDLKFAAHEFIKRELRHPKTAHFSDMVGQDEAVIPSGKNLWLVMGQVESQNSYGVEITNFYSVQLSCEPETGVIRLVDVSMSNN